MTQASAAIAAAPPSILVVEDEVMLRVVAAEVLSDAGYAVTEAPDGNAALDMLKSGAHFDLVLSDIRMPGMNGYQLVEAGMKLMPATKFLLMTGYAQEPVPTILSQAGVDILYKPFDFDRLPVIIQEILDN